MRSCHPVRRLGLDLRCAAESIEMRAVIVYESMFGNTRAIARVIAEGVGPDVRVLGVAEADAREAEGADLIIVGGPTHWSRMSRPSTRKSALKAVRQPGSDLVLEPGADIGPGVREWLDTFDLFQARAAAFDTRYKASAAIFGRASKGIARALSHHGLTVMVSPESFLVDWKSHLLPGETDRARAWGAQLATIVESQGAART